jgi:hypothetical protein
LRTNEQIFTTDIRSFAPKHFNSVHAHVASNVQKALLSFHCTAALVPSGEYALQPFYSCKTCSGEHIEGTGCCSTCASVCHAGHDLELSKYSTGSFCDCGTGEMELKDGRTFVCKAAQLSSADIAAMNKDGH